MFICVDLKLNQLSYGKVKNNTAEGRRTREEEHKVLKIGMGGFTRINKRSLVIWKTILTEEEEEEKKVTCLRCRLQCPGNILELYEFYFNQMRH